MSDGLKLFILGSARSGTSITYYAARDVLGLVGRGESHVFPIFHRMMHQYFLYAKSFKDTKGTLARELDVREYKLYMQEYVRSFYKRTYPGDSFVDKTPGGESVNCAPFILETFPDACMVATRRTGIEVVQSFQLKFAAGFEDACRNWANCMQALHRIHGLMPQILSIDQYELTNTPDDVAARLAAHVGRPELAGDLAGYFASKRTDQTSEHDWRERLTLDRVNWTDEQKVHFRKTCGPAMELFGYPM